MKDTTLEDCGVITKTQCSSECVEKTYFEKETVVSYECADAIQQYEKWPSPTVIISDGPYGVSGYKGDLHSSNNLDKWYEPHIAEWTKKSTPKTSLWFWNSEIGWATVHPILLKYGWEYKSCSIWDKGIGHIAGNCNTKTLSTFPIVSEVCVHYVKKPTFVIDSKTVSMQEWLIHEWKRTGLPFKKSNEACGVKDAASRKWLTKDHLWYMPPSDSFEKLVEYANNNGNPAGTPYFSINGKNPITKEEWDNMRAIFKCPVGVTNVWNIPQLKSEERIKDGLKVVHNNQKPLQIIRELIKSSSESKDVVWDPFGGLATTAVASYELGRDVYSCEIDKKMYEYGRKRLTNLTNHFF